MEIKFNINNYVKVKLTDVGKQIYSNGQKKLNQFYGKYIFELEPELDTEGYWKEQLWVIMAMFSDSIFNGCDIPFETEIILLP